VPQYLKHETNKKSKDTIARIEKLAYHLDRDIKTPSQEIKFIADIE
jgi:aspartyl aminopeptidase